MGCLIVPKVAGRVAIRRGSLLAQILRISSTVAVLSILLPVGISAERALQDQTKVSITPREKRASNANMRIDVKMILVPITVMDPTDHPVENLRPDVFRIFED